MLSDLQGESGARAPRETERQCLVRDENERTERANVALPAGGDRVPLRCECGDPDCRANVAPSHAEYEAVRASGSQFIVGVNHENPESAVVLREGAGFAIVDVVSADARYAVLARYGRHAWVEGDGRR